jgi:hypothetical protein
MLFKKRNNKMIDLTTSRQNIQPKHTSTNQQDFVDINKLTNNKAFFGFKDKPKTEFSDSIDGYNKREVDTKVTELDNKIYKLEQRIELLEKKLDINQTNNGNLIGW